MTLVIEGNDAEYLGNTVDFSTHGLCLQSEANLALGQPVGLPRCTNRTGSLSQQRVVRGSGTT